MKPQGGGVLGKRRKRRDEEQKEGNPIKKEADSEKKEGDPDKKEGDPHLRRSSFFLFPWCSSPSVCLLPASVGGLLA